MSRLLVAGLIGLTALIALGVRANADDEQPASQFVEGRQGPVLERFRSARSFQRYLASVERSRRNEDIVVYDMAAPQSVVLPGIEVAQAEPGNPAITNNQTVGVDEGGIVKQIGGFLVVLQDGRLFSADLGRGGGARLRLADRVDVYRSAATAASWYDEMLVLGNRILVTAYNYHERASEITVLRLDEAGRIIREGRYLLSSNDYYSTENYATRLVGDNLVFYAPLALDAREPDGRLAWPRLRRADGDAEADQGEALIGPTDVYAPVGEVDHPVLHTLSVCPLRRHMDCRTTAFVGPAMHELYVSPTDAFVWIGAPDGLPWGIDYANRRRGNCPQGESWMGGEDQPAMLYRLPLDGAAPGAIALEGIPADQFAFDSRGGRLRALLARTPAGCTKPDSARPLALLDIPLSTFGTRVRHLSDRAYASLPAVVAGELENRFVGEWLVYGGRPDWSGVPEASAVPARSELVAVPLSRPGGPRRLALPHNALRIERAGSDAVVTGYRDAGGLSVSYVSLGTAPRIAATTLLPRRFESEGRSHAFNAWVRADGSGMIGLPTTLREWRAGRGWSDSESSDLSFIAVAADKALAPVGELTTTGRDPPQAYRCEVSCVDWYGNSRPIFTGGRIFALMGSDLVEGRMEGGRIAELARLDLTETPGAR